MKALFNDVNRSGPNWEPNDDKVSNAQNRAPAPMPKPGPKLYDNPELREDRVVNYLRSFTNIPRANEIIQYNNFGNNNGRVLFPACEISGDLEQNGFYVKVFARNQRVGNRGWSWMMYVIATLNDHPLRQTEMFQNENEYKNWFQNSWLAKASCIDGEIKAVATAGSPMETGLMHSARRCGFASLVSHFCFRARDQIHGITPKQDRIPAGHRVAADPNWQNEELRDLLNSSPLMEHCQTMIYVHSARSYVGPYSTHIRLDLNKGGNKAFAYAAEAAGYEYMIAYNPEPCPGVQRTDVLTYNPDMNFFDTLDSGHIFEGTSCCGERENRRTEVFRVKDLIYYINKYEPPGRNPLFWGPQYGARQPRFNVMEEFTLHFGPHWYFCSATRHG